LEKLWAYLHASNERSERERAEERERSEREWAEERRRQAEESKRLEEERRLREEERKLRAEEHERQKERLDRMSGRVGGLGNTLGEIVEHLVAPGIEERFWERGIELRTTGSNLRLHEGGKTVAEVDVLLENDDVIMVVEVKSKPKAEDVAAHEERLERVRGCYGRRNDARRVFGAMAGAVFGAAEKKAALDAGIYVFVQSGDTMRLDVPEGFEPRAW